MRFLLFSFPYGLEGLLTEWGGDFRLCGFRRESLELGGSASEVVDSRTEAEKRFDEVQATRQAKILSKAASVTYREQVEVGGTVGFCTGRED